MLTNSAYFNLKSEKYFKLKFFLFCTTLVFFYEIWLQGLIITK